MLAWFTLAVLSALILGGLIVFDLVKSRGESAEERVWASWDEPLFFIQPMYGAEYAAETTAQYERALAMLKKHGNRFLAFDKDVFLWIHRATPHNPKLDFREWREQCRVDERNYKEEFDAEKARLAAGKKALLLRAKMLTSEKSPLEIQDFEHSQNGSYE